MTRRPVVVDGSNLATEGRSLPSLAQLDEAVRAWLAENPDDEVIVVVDASFGYRIDESERQMFEEAEDAGEVVSPPAGALGRGDGFLLRIADRVDGAVLSNDSFQEFHGEYKWLFDSGRLMGGKPVPGVGWIFTPRTPVRGPKSRMAVRDAQRVKSRSEPVEAAIEEAKAEAMAPEGAASEPRPRRRASRAASVAEPTPGPAPEAVNDPLPFITFIADHRLGTEVEGRVDSFTSHGAFVDVDGARCYVPVSGLGEPPPRTAKAVLKRDEVRSFVVQALDPPRRGIELALPGLARVAGSPTQETVEAEIDAGARRPPIIADRAPAPRRRRTAPSIPAAPVEAPPASAAPPVEEAPTMAAAAPEGVTPPPAARRTTKKASPPAVEAPKRASRARKASAPEPADARGGAAAAPKAGKAPKKAVTVPGDEAAKVPTPARSRRASAKKAARVAGADGAPGGASSPPSSVAAGAPAPPPGVDEPSSAAPAPVKRVRKARSAKAAAD
ncbi:MAG: NYN domain-containing protein [Acidimicrobiales bacterium]